MTRKTSLTNPKSWLKAAPIALMLTTTTGIVPTVAIEITHPKTVVELFTSQGCSSCPPADKVLREFNQGDEILGLAMHVDYWDRLGWKDTFASPENTKRQWRYAQSLGERQVYTPQAIINGRAHLVGSRKQQIAQQGESFASQGKGLSVPIHVSAQASKLRITIPASAENATLYAVYFSKTAQVNIERGENAGRQIDYSNIVSKVEMLGMVDGDGMELSFSMDELHAKGYANCALILQTSKEDGMIGPIIGATVISDL